MGRRFHLFLSILVGLVLVASIYGARVAKLTLSPAQVRVRIALVLIPLGFVFYCRWRKAEKLKNLFLVAFWSLAILCLHHLPVYIAARQHVMLRDALLAEIDRWVGLEVPDVLRFMEPYPALTGVLNICYVCLWPLVFLALSLPVLCDKLASVKEYIIANLVSLALLIPLFSIFQAVGPWYYYGYAPNAEQERTMRIFLALKSDDWFTLEPSTIAGLVAFPSFHTTLAVLSAVALWCIPYVRWFAAVLTCLIIVSTVTTGWHYLADVLAGLVIAGISLAAARGLARLEAKWSGTSIKA